MEHILEFLEAYSGAFTFLITVVYVVATIFICFANIKSAKATRDQISESQRQFNENRRLDIMPYLQFETTHQSRVDDKLALILSENDYKAGEYLLNLRVKNIGRGTAKDIEYIWTNFTNTYSKQPFMIKALQDGDERFLQMSFARPRALDDVTKANVELYYKDLLENTYSQKIEFEFEIKHSSVWLKRHTTYPIIPIAKKITASEETTNV